MPDKAVTDLRRPLAGKLGDQRIGIGAGRGSGIAGLRQRTVARQDALQGHRREQLASGSFIHDRLQGGF
jgi:hypothetical protein